MDLKFRLLRVDTATLLVSPISSIFWLGLAWTWRSGIVLLAVAVNYIFRAMIIRALILPGSAPTVVKKMIVPSETVQCVFVWASLSMRACQTCVAMRLFENENAHFDNRVSRLDAGT